MTRPQSSRANATSPPIAPGSVLADKYVVEGFIGEGGMAYVVSARHRELDELVAIKFLKPGQQNEELVRRFAREAKAMAKLKSQYITRIHDVGMSLEHGPYIVMELLQGENLGAVLHRLGALPVRTAVDITLQAAIALAEAHSRGIVHRDVKPENIFLHAPDGNLERATVKLVDFGVSKAYLTGVTFGTSVEMSKTTTLVGSPLYMSPEQIRAKEDVDHRTDIWALGIVLYELLTNESPFLAASIPELSAKILEASPRSIRDSRPDIEENLEEIVLKCMRKDPELRFQSMRELAEALSTHASAPYAHLVHAFPTGLSSSGEVSVRSGTREISSLSMTPRSLSDSSQGATQAAPHLGTTHSSRTQPQERGEAPLSQTANSSRLSQPSQPSQPSQSSGKKVVLVGLGLGLLVVGMALRPNPPAPPVLSVQSAVVVELRSDPPGASVEVDGAWRGVTPLKTELQPGSRHLKLVLAGHEPSSVMVPVPSVGEVPPLPVVALKPLPPPATLPPSSAVAAQSAAPADPTTKPKAPPVSAETAARRPVEAPPPPAATPTPTSTAPTRPRVIEDKPHVKVID